MAAGGNSPIYDDLMRFKPESLTPNAWAVTAGVSRTVWADMRRHGNPSRRTLERLLTAAGSSLAEFEALRIHGSTHTETVAGSGLSDRSARGWERPQLPALPVLATAMAGEWGDPAAAIELMELRAGEIVDRTARPASLANDSTAYAVTIVGDSMWPRFRPGRRVAVSARSPVAVGDDVLVKLKPSPEVLGGASLPVLIKALVRRSGSGVELRQFNPDVTFKVEASQIDAIEKVLGELV
jgi:phage repressor protein C with HTH and peptisase S24 domain